MPSRALQDRCPGVARLIEAVDGHLARVRLPGGLIGAGGLRVLAAASRDLGDGRLELTSRGNVQLRALAVDAGVDLGARLDAVGLLPSLTHERVRNVVASPLAGLDGSGGLDEVVRALDAGLCADPALAALSGRFLFALDDGRGDVARLRPDVLAVVGPDSAWVEGFAVGSADVVAAMLAIARAFLAERAAQASDAWRVADLAGGATRVRARVTGVVRDGPPLAHRPRGAVGALPQWDGGQALTVLPPLGRLTSAQADGLAELLDGRAAGAKHARITPWRTVVLPDLKDADGAATVARGAGLVTEPGSPWVGVSACAGRPGCAKALADVQGDAAGSLGRWPGLRVHWSGCDRRCGRPRDTEVDVVATRDGYAIETARAG